MVKIARTRAHIHKHTHMHMYTKNPNWKSTVPKEVSAHVDGKERNGPRNMWKKVLKGEKRNKVIKSIFGQHCKMKEG